MIIKTLTVGQLKTNCFLAFNESDHRCVIIDPGDDAEYIIREIISLELTPDLIIATHGHFDHILAVTELKMAFNIPFLMSKKDRFLLKRMRKSAKYYLGIETDPPPSADKFIADKDIIKTGNITLKVIETPGHTPGSLTLYEKSENIIFVGDLIFEGGAVGRTDFAYSDAEMLKKSVDKIIKMDKDTVVYSGHGSSFSINDFINPDFISF